jgi:hypothetical protein
MTVAVSYPGVYIDEFAPGAPIQAAGTNIAAFLGPMLKGPVVGAKGPIKEPVKVTSWDQFKILFGARPTPGFFTWYSVRGFFENGGTACYVYRVTNAEYAFAAIQNQGADTLADVFATDAGEVTTPILLDFQQPPEPLLPPGATLFVARVTGAEVNGSVVTIQQNTDRTSGNPGDARLFRVGDWVVISANNQPLGKPARVRSVTPDTLVIDERYGNVADAEVKLVYIPGGEVRVQVPVPAEQIPPDALAIGTTIQFTGAMFTGPNNIDTQVIDGTRSEQITRDFRTYRLTLRDGFRTQVDPTVGVTASTITFHVEISQGGSPLRFNHLSADPASDRYYVNEINRARHLVRIYAKDPMPFVPPEGVVPAFSAVSVSGGTAEDLNRLVDNNFIDGFNHLRRLGDIRLVSAPDGYPRDTKPTLTSAVQAAMIAHCEQMGDRFAVIDARPNLELFGSGSGSGSIETQRGSLDSQRGYAGLYYPWVRVSAAGNGPPLLIPPSGHVCGLMARVDNTKGVFKAPANEILQGTIGVERTMTDAEHGLLNLQGINIIRVFREGGRPYVYGARTTATDLNWNYVNIRRLFLFLEKSIQDGIRWAVFEPSNKSLWDKLEHTISAFLSTQWKAGALFGDSPKDAYYVRIDDALNPFEEQRQGRLNIEIGIRPTYPAEFIIVRIGIWQGGSEVSEG